MIWKTTSTRTTQNIFSQFATKTNVMGGVWRKVAALSVGIFCSPCMASHVVFAGEHDDSARIQHAIQEILAHGIWHKTGHYVLQLSSFASGVLGGLLSSQSLGEKESFYIPQPISKPLVTKCVDPRTGKMEDCLVLPNGRKLVGQEILRFSQDLQAVQILKSLEKGRRL